MEVMRLQELIQKTTKADDDYLLLRWISENCDNQKNYPKKAALQQEVPIDTKEDLLKQ